MLAIYLTISLFQISEQYENLLTPTPPEDGNEVIQCVIGILDKYFSQKKELTFVDMNSRDNNLIRVIHSTTNFSLIYREAKKQMFVSNQGYLILSPDVETFSNYFQHLMREPLWNPYARFLIIIESLRFTELKEVFDELLRLHVNNVLLVNGTGDGNLYTYNPFDNYACGRYYNDVINYGLCSQASNNLYPNKLVTGLRNCTFRGSLTHRPPYTIEPSENEYRNKLPGLEQYVLNTVSESDEFKVDFKFNFDGWSFSRVASNMTVYGPMAMLQKNKTDVIFSTIMVSTSFAAAFTYVNGYNDYVDEYKFAVKKASFVPSWKYLYLEFEAVTWFLLLVCIIVYSAIVILLLRPKDKGAVILKLFGNLLLQGHITYSPLTVKYVIIMWIWFAYLVNTFYQSSLVSLTTNPSKEYQISNEEEIIKYNFRPCITMALARYIYTDRESRQYFWKNRVNDVNCETYHGSIDIVNKNNNVFTILVTYFYLYNNDIFNDKYGDPLNYYIEKPISKLLPVYHFYKGFPISKRFKLNMMRMRESGLAEKNLRDQYYMRSLKNRFSEKEFKCRFVSPWILYGAGCLMATACFIIELAITIVNK